MKNEKFFRYPGFLTKACTLSYDDGATDDVRLIEIMRKHGLKGTFNLNSYHLNGSSPSRLRANEINDIIGDDTEIALHGYEHLYLSGFSSPIIVRDVLANKEHLEE